jgi:hypothetical protein
VRLFCTRLASPGTRVAFYARQNVPFVRARSTFTSNRESSSVAKSVSRAREDSQLVFFSSERSERIFQVYDAGLALLPPAAPLFQSHRHFYEFGISLLFGPLGASFFTTARSLLAALVISRNSEPICSRGAFAERENWALSLWPGGKN